MAQNQILGRGAPWAQGRTWSPPSVSEGSNVRVFGSKGIASPGVLGTSPLPQIGTLIPGTPYVYIKPRLTQDDLGGTGGSIFLPYKFPGAPSPQAQMAGQTSVHRTNPEWGFYKERRRGPSLGMGAVLSYGASMDVPFQAGSGVPFSVA